MRRLFVGLAFAGIALAAEGGEHEAASVEKWKWVNFAILAGGLGYLVVKTGKPAMRQQREEILTRLKDAETRGKAAAEKAAEIDRRLAGLQAEMTKLKESARAEMQREAERLRAEAAQHIAKVERMAESEISAAQKEASRKLRHYASDLALKLAQTKVAQRMNPEVQEALVKRFAESLHEVGAKN